MKGNPLTDDLSVLARREEASASELRRLDMLLKASPVERFLYELGCDYDVTQTDERGDDALLARVVGRLSGPPPIAPRWSRRHVAVAGVAVGCFVTLGAAAIAAPRLWSPPPPPHRLTAGSVSPQRASRAPQSKRGPASEPSASNEGARPAPPSQRSASPSSWASAESTPPPSQAQPRGARGSATSAAEQFAHANALRKSGQSDAAIVAYGQLQRSHPGSSEAVLSHVVLGRLLLQQGSSSAAVQQFSRYLRVSPGGSLAEEALHGKAAALRASGRSAEEAQVHRALLNRFPNSVYARTSRARLDELE